VTADLNEIVQDQEGQDSSEDRPSVGISTDAPQHGCVGAAAEVKFRRVI
jgi:hypothetical protein